MARQKKFVKGNLIILASGYAATVTKTQYIYRGKPVIDAKDGEESWTRLPLQGIKHYDTEFPETESTELPQESVTDGGPNPHYVEPKPYNKYNRTVKDTDGNSVVVDVYSVLDGFNVTCPALQHLIKKALCVGIRGHKDTDQDLQDINASAIRAIQLNKNRNLSQ